MSEEKHIKTYGFQEMISNAIAVERAEKMKTSDQLTLGELILKLEAVSNQEATVYYEFLGLFPQGLASWRGSYEELALDVHGSLDRSIPVGAPLTVAQLLDKLRDAIGNTFEGYKGGEYIMGKTTPLWVANWGDTGAETAVIGVRCIGDYVFLTTGHREL